MCSPCSVVPWHCHGLIVIKSHCSYAIWPLPLFLHVPLLPSLKSTSLVSRTQCSSSLQLLASVLTEVRLRVFNLLFIMTWPITSQSWPESSAPWGTDSQTVLSPGNPTVCQEPLIVNPITLRAGLAYARGNVGSHRNSCLRAPLPYPLSRIIKGITLYHQFRDT